ncbi:MAG: homocysteine S-methyltransferase family protein [Acidobacteriia bacterium]|nr:homocysteine S-methyltransferase family protein [Terriglobia bacterium]
MAIEAAPTWRDTLGQAMVTVMDGGMGRELIRRGAALRSGLWSAKALIDAPRVVVEVHRDFIAAGARIITTNSYSCVPSYLGKTGEAHRFAELAGLSGQLAREAADGSAEPVLVAGSLPPLDESYRPDLVIDDSEARPIYAALAQALQPHVDLFLCETMSCIRESRNAAEAALAAGAARSLPVYVSWTLDEEPGTGLRSGESIQDAHAALADLPLAGFLFNCTHSDAIEAGIEQISQLTDLPTGGYPNRFNVPKGFTLDGEISVQARADFETGQFVRAARRFVDRGASFVGGCCGIGPEDIAALAEHLSRADALEH